MRSMCFFLFVSLLSTAYAQDGRVLKIIGDQIAYVLKQGQKSPLTIDTEIVVGDEVFSEESMIVLHLFPSTQLSLSKNTHVKIDQNLIEKEDGKDKSLSVISFIKGIIRLQVTKDASEVLEQKVESPGVAFAVRGTDYELSMTDNEVDLDVHEGEVEASSPYVQTFVPQIVKAGKGFRFQRKQKNFATRKFAPLFKNHPGFFRREEIRARWTQAKALREMKQGARFKKQNNRKTRRGNHSKSERPKR
jgi:hypothetical protein